MDYVISMIHIHIKYMQIRGSHSKKSLQVLATSFSRHLIKNSYIFSNYMKKPVTSLSHHFFPIPCHHSSLIHLSQYYKNTSNQIFLRFVFLICRWTWVKRKEMGIFWRILWKLQATPRSGKPLEITWRHLRRVKKASLWTRGSLFHLPK